MKIVVFSDVHGNQQIVDRILDFNPDADYIMSLGDSELQKDYLDRKQIIYVRGNYPRDPGLFYDKDIVLDGKRIFLTHGHRYGVRHSVAKLVKLGIQKDYHLMLYGHTHVAQIDYVSGIYIVNPGSCARPRTSLPPTYLIINLNEGEMAFTYKDVLTNQTIEI